MRTSLFSAMVEGCADLTATLLLIGVMDLRAMGDQRGQLST
jgi:hypothetical protein